MKFKLSVIKFIFSIELNVRGDRNSSHKLTFSIQRVIVYLTFKNTNCIKLEYGTLINYRKY